MFRRLALVVAPLLIAAFALTGCSPEPRIPAAEPQPTASPLFATDEEALAAATAAYEEYLAVLDDFLQNPRTVGDEFDGIAEEQALESALADIDSFREQALRTSGPRSVQAIQFQSFLFHGDDIWVMFYACEDIRGVDLLDGSGNVLTEDERPDLVAFEIAVRFPSSTGVVSMREYWQSDGVCL